MKWIISILTMMLLVTACATQPAIESETPEGDEVAGFNLIEVRLVNDLFDPSTIIVSQGDNVRLQFLNADTYTFSLPDYSIAERVGNNYIEFVADKKGVFDFECADCNASVTGVLRVN